MHPSRFRRSGRIAQYWSRVQLTILRNCNRTTKYLRKRRHHRRSPAWLDAIAETVDHRITKKGAELERTERSAQAREDLVLRGGGHCTTRARQSCKRPRATPTWPKLWHHCCPSLRRTRRREAKRGGMHFLSQHRARRGRGRRDRQTPPLTRLRPVPFDTSGSALRLGTMLVCGGVEGCSCRRCQHGKLIARSRACYRTIS